MGCQVLSNPEHSVLLGFAYGEGLQFFPNSFSFGVFCPNEFRSESERPLKKVPERGSGEVPEQGSGEVPERGSGEVPE